MRWRRVLHPQEAGRSVVLRDALVLVLVVVYAFCFVAIKAGLAYAPPVLLAGLRSLIAGTSLFVLAAALRRRLLPRRDQWIPLASLAVTSTTIGLGAMFLAPRHTGAGVASVLGNTQPLVVAVLAAGFLGERLTRSTAAALGLGLAGVALVSLGGLEGLGASDAAGSLLALAASAGIGIGSVLFKRMGRQHDPLLVASWQLLLGGAPLLLAGAIAEHGSQIRWNGDFVSLVLFLALPGTAFAIPAWYWLVQREVLGRLSVFLFLVPVFGLALAVVFDGESVSLVEGAGVALTLTAATVAGRARREDAGPPGGTFASPASSPQPVLSHATAVPQRAVEDCGCVETRYPSRRASRP